MMEQYGVASAEEVKVENLADRLRIEITAAGTVCATPCAAEVLLLDEPSFGLAPLVVQEIFRILRSINRNEGVSILLVERSPGRNRAQPTSPGASAHGSNGQEDLAFLPRKPRSHGARGRLPRPPINIIQIG